MPILDLDTESHLTRYRPTQRLREQVILTCPTCTFPGCGRPARTCDPNHPRAPPRRRPPTTPWNLAPAADSTTA